jgi:hypothetical protein
MAISAHALDTTPAKPLPETVLFKSVMCSPYVYATSPLMRENSPHDECNAGSRLNHCRHDAGEIQTKPGRIGGMGGLTVLALAAVRGWRYEIRGALSGVVGFAIAVLLFLGNDWTYVARLG